MPIRVVIVEDEKPARDRLRRLLSEHPDCAIVGEAADAASAAALIDRERPDLCFLDVEMPEGDGFEVLRRVRHAPRVIFTTAYDRYAVPAFEVNSLDYLLKPFSRERFDAALERARAALATGSGAPAPADLLRLIEEIRRAAPSAPAAAGPAAPLRIPVRRASKIVLLDPGEILWFEAEETIVFARTEEARLLVERPLNDLEELLKPGFFRIHRAYLVNVSRIAEIQPEEGGTARVIMKDAARTPLPLSRRQARLLRDLLPW
ncbi:MAG TPA: LytTR family DNA-binding domain-containing protein [Candidatus Polarisedimenticolia bacterium]|nr:LytTR family DNA-binding domain-containing protein [Candidatus Polarisedimenticolia bacterium]